MIVHMPGARILVGPQMPWGINSAQIETGIRVKPVRLELQIMIHDDGSRIGVITDSIAAHPGIHQGQSEDENQNEDFVVSIQRHSLGRQGHFTSQRPPPSSDRSAAPKFALV